MKLMLPTTVIVKGAHYNIVLTNTLDLSETDFIYGACDPRTRTIYIKKHLSELQTLATLAHEILHAFEFEWDIKLGHPVIEKIELPLAHLIRSNLEILYGGDLRRKPRRRNETSFRKNAKRSRDH